MIRVVDAYPGKTAGVSPEYPDGKARNISSPGDGTGTPWEAQIVNDFLGLQQYLTSKAGITPSGTPDDAVTNQQFEAMWTLLNSREVTHNITADSDYTLTLEQNFYPRVRITDTGVVLTGAINIILNNTQREVVAYNDTAQDLTFKTVAGTGVLVKAGAYAELYVDGTNVDKNMDGSLNFNNLFHIQDRKTDGTAGGGSSVGWNDRDLNFEVVNNTEAVLEVDDTFTLPANTTWLIFAKAPMYDSSNGRNIKLRNNTLASDAILGVNSRVASSSGGIQTHAFLTGVIEVGGSDENFKLQHYFNSAVGGAALGQLNNIAGQVEIYSDIQAFRVR